MPNRHAGQKLRLSRIGDGFYNDSCTELEAADKVFHYAVSIDFALGVYEFNKQLLFFSVQ